MASDVELADRVSAFEQPGRCADIEPRVERLERDGSAVHDELARRIERTAAEKAKLDDLADRLDDIERRLDRIESEL